ncbi:hypothetical protein BDB01DRAFT_773516 [Pilobolus umbonatus]|nr:hypothetical protein BDB01DRAFT_773516 [Pilobolus umbonatus]
MKQAEITGRALIDLMQRQIGDMKNTTVVIYSSPFQRCVDTSVGIVRGMEDTKKLIQPPILRLDLGLGEWMCESFFDSVCPAAHMISRQQEQLARQQAYTYSMKAKEHADESDTTLPSMYVDYGYTADRVEFDYPESYADMIDRFAETRLSCLNNASLIQMKKSTNNEQDQIVVMVFVTHAVGVNALVDSFLNRLSRPIECGYCSISCVRSHTNSDANSDQSDEDIGESEYYELSNHHPVNSKWYLELSASIHHLQ